MEPRYNHTQCIITNSPRENKTVIKEKKRKKTMTIQNFLTNIRERVHKRLSGNKMKKKKNKQRKKRKGYYYQQH